MTNKFKIQKKLSKIKNMPQQRKLTQKFRIILKNLKKKTNIYGTLL